MSDVALTNAESRRDALAAQINAAQQQIDEWKRELRGVEQFISAWHSFAANGTPGVDRSDATQVVRENMAENLADPGAKPRQRLRNSKKEEVAQVALDIIHERGKPVLRSDLFKELIARGLRIEGADPGIVLSTMLWRMQDVIIRIPRFGYWPRDEKFEPAGYDPSIPYPGDQEHSDMGNIDLSGRLPDVD